ncbi:MAG TPA: methyltransferase domain-containing protein [Candidatus Bathyarchaeia archaeon]|nr:methyltransferase domain-containing protein [Candidatus Bathyarchaeia archaeon]
MPFFAPLARAVGTLEIIDGPNPVPFAEMACCMTDISRVNGLFGGRMVTMIHVRKLLADLPADRLVTVLDVGTGAGDIPRALVRWARREGRRIRVFALDRDAATLQIAARIVREYPEITFLRGDALALPIRPGAVDLTISAMTLHHLEPDAGARYLVEMDRAARVGFVVNDLVRSRIAHAVVWLITRFITRSAISRHDGPLSVRRSYTPPEVDRLCEEAGLRGVSVVHHWPYFRFCAVRAKGAMAAG